MGILFKEIIYDVIFVGLLARQQTQVRGLESNGIGERRAKMKKTSKTLENLLEFMGDPEGLTTEEIEEELEGYGIDIDNLKKAVMNIKDKYSQRKKESQNENKS